MYRVLFGRLKLVDDTAYCGALLYTKHVHVENALSVISL